MKTILILNSNEVENKVIEYLYSHVIESMELFKNDKKKMIENIIGVFTNPDLLNNDYDEYFADFLAENEGYDLIYEETADVNYHVKNLPSLAKIYNSEKD